LTKRRIDPAAKSGFHLRAIFLFVAVIILAYPRPAHPVGDRPTDFGVALKAAESNRKTNRGSMYDAAFTLKSAPWLGRALYGCSRNLSRGDYRPVVILVRISAEGRAEEVLIRPSTKVSRCLKGRFVSAEYPKPPGPSWWVKMELKVR
jgi:hypothetical protein